KLSLPTGRFKLPPREVEKILPQQLLMLKVAFEALEDVRSTSRAEPPVFGMRSGGPHVNAGTVIGLGLDLETTSFHLRWLMRSRAGDWARQLGLSLSEAELDRWSGELCEALTPALDSTRTLGALGGIVASRVAREFQLGGPSFGVSGEEC